MEELFSHQKTFSCLDTLHANLLVKIRNHHGNTNLLRCAGVEQTV